MYQTNSNEKEGERKASIRKAQRKETNSDFRGAAILTPPRRQGLIRGLGVMTNPTGRLGKRRRERGGVGRVIGHLRRVIRCHRGRRRFIFGIVKTGRGLMSVHESAGRCDL